MTHKGKPVRLNKSEEAVLDYVARDGFFTTDPGRGQRMNRAAYTLVEKGVCKVICRGCVIEENRRRTGRHTEYSRRPYSTIRVACLP
jgi:hypothetical protein